MSLADLMASDVSDVLFNTSDFSSSVTHWPRGSQQHAATVTANVLPMEVLRESDGGEQFEARLELQVQTSVTVDERDIWVISSERWCVERLGNIETGIRPIHLKRVTPNLTSKSRGGVL